MKSSCFYKQTKALPRLCKLFHLKMTCTFCTDDVGVKIPSFQKVTQFLPYKIFHRDIIHQNVCLFEDIPDCPDLSGISFKSFASFGIFVSATQLHEDQYYQQLDDRNSALSFAINKHCIVLYALLSATWH